MSTENNTKKTLFTKNGAMFFAKGAAMKIGLCCKEGEQYVNGFIQINNLDENNKFIKDEDGKFDSASYQLLHTDLVDIALLMDSLLPAGYFINPEDNNNQPHIGGIIKQKIFEDNNGSRLEISLTEEGLAISIYTIENNEAVDEHFVILDRNNKVLAYDTEGNEININTNNSWYDFKLQVQMVAMLSSGMALAIPEVARLSGGRNSSRNNTVGSINMGTRKRAGGFNRRIQNQDNDSSEGDEVVEETPRKKKTSKRVSKKDMASILEDDED